MKNKYSLQRLIGGIIVAVGVLIIIIICLCTDGESGMITGFFISLPFLIVGGIWYCIATGNSRKFCDQCGGSLAGCAYQYQERRRKASNDGRSIDVVVNIIATCPHCGAVKQFDKSFHVSNDTDNIQFQVDQFCRNKFGH